jgi:hypothetical protein
MKLQLSNKALEHLINCLSLPGWCKHENPSISVKRTYLAGKILADLLPVVPDSPLLAAGLEKDSHSVRSYNKTLLAWCEAKDTPEFELDDKQIEVCVVAIKHFIALGNTPTGKAMNELLEVFKATE